MINETVLGAVIIYFGVINWMNRKEATEREKDLLNRVMSYSDHGFKDYVQGTQRLEEKNQVIAGVKKPTLEEIQAAMSVEEGLSVG